VSHYSGYRGHSRGASHPSHRAYVPLARRTPTLPERFAGHRPPAAPAPAEDTVTPHLQVSVFTTDARLSELVDVIAEAVHAALEHLDDQPAEQWPYAALTADERLQARAHVIAMVLHQDPWRRAGALQSARLAGDSVQAYLDALRLQAPRRIEIRVAGQS
jgi:hypothetical protein